MLGTLKSFRNDLKGRRRSPKSMQLCVDTNLLKRNRSVGEQREEEAKLHGCNCD
jgi:hypothetical protein